MGRYKSKLGPNSHFLKQIFFQKTCNLDVTLSTLYCMKSKKMLEHIRNYDDLSFTGPIGPFDPNENFSKKHNFLYLLTPLIVQNSLEHIQS